MEDKIKGKIERLLNLSMSDNEHESSLALQRALKLMNEHNITKDDIYKQNFISKNIELDYLRVPDWVVKINTYMAKVSGCVFTWVNGNGYFERKARGRFTGRERDVENAVYLSVFLKREVEKRTKIYKTQIDEVYAEKYKRLLLKSYKVGIIHIVSKKLLQQSDMFFNKQNTGTELICIDREARILDSYAFLEELLGGKAKDHTSKSQYEQQGLKDGMCDGDNIELNQTITKQDEILRIER